uniref:Uncharacterized protein n=1 Tax=Anopheles atroparvus TaxID=41427 RepID=A0A182IZL2_ANOAO
MNPLAANSVNHFGAPAFEEKRMTKYSCGRVSVLPLGQPAHEVVHGLLLDSIPAGRIEVRFIDVALERLDHALDQLAMLRVQLLHFFQLGETAREWRTASLVLRRVRNGADSDQDEQRE